jgi:Protein of unknown function (DUF3501)
MQALQQSDLWPLPIYEGVREQFRREVIAAKKDRRISVGPFMTLVFENRLTVKFQVQEILRIEKITDPAHVQEELDGFNAMLPGPGSLSATLLIELTGPEAEVARTLTGLTGLAGHLKLEVGGHASVAQFEDGREDGKRISAVQYVRFPCTQAIAEALAKGTVPARLVFDHPNYTHAQALTEGGCRSLAKDLGGN